MWWQLAKFLQVNFCINNVSKYDLLGSTNHSRVWILLEISTIHFYLVEVNCGQASRYSLSIHLGCFWYKILCSLHVTSYNNLYKFQNFWQLADWDLLRNSSRGEIKLYDTKFVLHLCNGILCAYGFHQRRLFRVVGFYFCFKTELTRQVYISEVLE